MKDVLEYTHEELDQMTNEELLELQKEADGKQSLKNTSQLVLKLLINSLYGCMSNKYFPLYNEHMARAITGNGRYFIQLMARTIESGLQEMTPSQKPYIVYGDTDSNYFSVENFVERAFQYKPDATITDKVNFCDNFYNQVVDGLVQNSIEQFGLEYNAYNTDVIGSEREIIADAGVWTAKKKYFARVIDSEGVRYEKPKLKVMGLDIIKSGTPKFVKKKLKSSLDIILDSSIDDMIQWKDTVKEEFVSQNLNDIAKVQGVSNIDYKVGDKGIPIGARSVMIHNAYIKKLGIENEIQLLEAGTKVKQMYLKEPNIFGSNIIAWSDDKFVKYLVDSGAVDFELCFEKYFLSPLELMTTALSWNIRKTTEELDVW